jgi:hypothetical protein
MVPTLGAIATVMVQPGRGWWGDRTDLADLSMTAASVPDGAIAPYSAGPHRHLVKFLVEHLRKTADSE